MAARKEPAELLREARAIIQSLRAECALDEYRTLRPARTQALAALEADIEQLLAQGAGGWGARSAARNMHSLARRHAAAVRRLQSDPQYAQMVRLQRDGRRQT
ncbi:MAG TPA: hypothetical protein VNT60_05060 [Deinococcales bacterium]|nr:hypothetical protein [Deinococcales bacterium]